MEYRTVRDAPTSELIKSLVGSYDTARVVRLGGQSCILAREETIAQEIDKRIPAPNAKPAPVSGWQPIESAPMLEFVLVTVADSHELPMVARMSSGMWHVLHQHDGYRIWEGRKPTHWMPLPERP